MASRTRARAAGGRGGRLRPAVEPLEGKQLLAAPAIEAIAAVDLPAGTSTFVPVRGSDADGDAITYTVSSSAAGVQAAVRSGRPYLKLSVQGFGDLTFQLFDDLAPETVRRITELVNANFYDNLTFHRVIPGFVIQGGDPSGDGTGGPGFQFGDEFSPTALFTGGGQLAMANSGKDTNGSQFFVTLGPQRALDFNHTIFGQLVRGQEVAQAIANTPRGASDRPTTPVVITDAQIVQDTTDTVLALTAAPNAGPATITVTATDPNGESTTQTFAVNVAADTVDDPPILGPIGDQSAVAGAPLTFTLSSTDVEGDPVEYQATLLDNAGRATVSVSGNAVTVTPAADFSGNLTLRVGVKQQGATRRGSTTNPFDTQQITVAVAPMTISAEGVAVSGTAGTALTSVPVARFSANGGAPASSFSATINWGDNTTSAGTVVAASGGGYQVVGTHTYAGAGSFPISVQVSGPSNVASASATATATVSAAQAAALAVTITDAPDPVAVGDTLTYTVEVRNTGTAAAPGVVLSQVLPANSTFVSASIPPTSQANGQVEIGFGTIAPGASRSVAIVVRPTAAGSVSSTARVTGQGVSAVTAGAVSTVNAAPTGPTNPNPTTPTNPTIPVSPVRMVNLERFGVGRDATRIVLTFSGPVDRARAEDVRNYRLVLPGGDGRMGSGDDLPVPIARASYDEATRAVTLEPRFRLPYVQMARLVVRSGGVAGLNDGTGAALDGDGDGSAGGAVVARFGRGVYLDRAEVLRESATPDGPGPIRPVVRAGGQAFRVGAIAPLFAPEAATARFLLAAGIADASSAAGLASASQAAGSDLPQGPRPAWRRARILDV